MRTPARYLAFQLPGWMLAGLAAFVAWEWLAVPGWLSAAAVAAWVAKDLALYPLVRQAYEGGAPTGAAALIGAPGVVEEPLRPAGSVKVRGELWRAEVEPAGAPLPSGAPVRIRGARGLTLIVSGEPAPAPRPEPRSAPDADPPRGASGLR